MLFQRIDNISLNFLSFAKILNILKTRLTARVLASNLQNKRRSTRARAYQPNRTIVSRDFSVVNAGKCHTNMSNSQYKLDVEHASRICRCPHFKSPTLRSSVHLCCALPSPFERVLVAPFPAPPLHTHTSFSPLFTPSSHPPTSITPHPVFKHEFFPLLVVFSFRRSRRG